MLKFFFGEVRERRRGISELRTEAAAGLKEADVLASRPLRVEDTTVGVRVGVAARRRSGSLALLLAAGSLGFFFLSSHPFSFYFPRAKEPSCWTNLGRSSQFFSTTTPFFPARRLQCAIPPPPCAPGRNGSFPPLQGCNVQLPLLRMPPAGMDPPLPCIPSPLEQCCTPAGAVPAPLRAAAAAAARASFLPSAQIRRASSSPPPPLSLPPHR